MRPALYPIAKPRHRLARRKSAPGRGCSLRRPRSPRNRGSDQGQAGGLSSQFHRDVGVRAAVQIDSWSGRIFGKIKQFTCNFTGLNSTSDVIEQQRARSEPPAREISDEQPIGQVGLGSFHNAEVENPALFIPKKQVSWTSIDSVHTPRRHGRRVRSGRTRSVAIVRLERRGQWEELSASGNEACE